MKKVEIVFPNIDRKSNPELDQKLQELEKEMQEDFERFLKEEDEDLTECPYCGIIGAGPVMKRFHFERCENK